MLTQHDAKDKQIENQIQSLKAIVIVGDSLKVTVKEARFSCKCCCLQ
jgi:hypothetical protein